jgi:hypothetical protein
MTSIGIRANNSEVYFSILIGSGSKDARVSSCSYVFIPVALNFPERLNFLRKTFKDLIMEFEISRAGIRISESTAQNFSIDRISYEAVIQELLASSSIEKYMTGQISSISAKLGFPRDNFKKIIAGEMAHQIFRDGKKYNALEKESILVGLAALNIN